MEFKSQICTTKEQSERLLKLGLKKETADMMYITDANVPEEHRYYDLVPECYEPCLEGIVHIPAWSLHRLTETIDYPSNIDAIKELLAAKTMFNDRLYDRVIDIIEYLISNNNFNKDYLEEKK